MVVAALSPTRDNLAAKDRVLKELFRKYAKQYGGFHGRLKVAVDEAVAQVRQIVQGRPIRSVEGTGESRKGVDSVDLKMTLDSGTEEFSLKLYRTASNVNLWNPTLNSLFKRLAGKSIADLLSKEELAQFSDDMRSLKDMGVKSEGVTGKWIDRFVVFMDREYQRDPQLFRESLCGHLGLRRGRLIALLVNKQGKLEQTVTQYPAALMRLQQPSVRLGFHRNGVSIEVLAGSDVITRFSIYAASSSKGRTGGLRVATWTPGFFTSPAAAEPRLMD